MGLAKDFHWLRKGHTKGGRTLGIRGGPMKARNTESPYQREPVIELGGGGRSLREKKGSKSRRVQGGGEPKFG